MTTGLIYRRRNPSDSARTVEQIRSLRKQQSAEIESKPSLSPVWLLRFIGCIWSDFNSMMFSPLSCSDLSKNMCKHYGHVIRGKWKGYLPKCDDCGCTVKSADQLRRAQPK